VVASLTLAWVIEPAVPSVTVPSPVVGSPVDDAIVADADAEVVPGAVADSEVAGLSSPEQAPTSSADPKSRPPHT